MQRSARRLSMSLLVPMLMLALAPAGSAGEDAAVHGVTTANVEHVRFVPFEAGTATGARIVGDYLYLTSWKNISIYDISDPVDPQLVSITPIGFKFESEDMPTNGEILIFSETLPSSVLHVWDVSDKAAPVEIATLSGSGEHTMTCLYDCEWLYGSGGAIIDLRDPANPKEVGNWGQRAGSGTGHDVNEVRPGLVLVANSRGALLDTTDPEAPVLLAETNTQTERPAHSARWPNAGTDRFVLGQNETNANPRCGGSNGSFTTWDTTGWEESGRFKLLDAYRVTNGFIADADPVVNGLGCSAHWFEEHPSFDDGGLVAMGYYEHGTRFFWVSGAGEISQVGVFLPNAGSTSAAYWRTDRIVYAIDYTRGIDILRWNGPIGSGADEANGVSGLTASGSGDTLSVSGSASFAGEDLVSVAPDPSGDGPLSPEHATAAGVDLVDARISQPDAGYPALLFEWEVVDLPLDATTGALPEGVRYTFNFTINGVEWFIAAKSTNLASSTQVDDPQGHVTEASRSFQLRGNCGVIGVVNSCPHVAWLEGEFDAGSNTIRTWVPLGGPISTLQPGATLTSMDDGVFASFQVVADNATTRDVAFWEAPYRVPERAVTLAVEPAGTPPAFVSFDTPATLGADGSFSADVGGLAAGDYDVYARSCFGTTCATEMITATM